MSDDNKVVADATPEIQESKSDEVLQEIEKLRAIKDDVVKQRDELKEKLRSIEETKLKESEKWKELADLKARELEAKELELNSLTEFKTKYTELETALKSELLENLSDEHKELAKDFDIQKLKTYVKLNGKPKSSVDSTPSGGGLRFVAENKKYDDYTSEQLAEISKMNPELYVKLRKEKFNF